MPSPSSEHSAARMQYVCLFELGFSLDVAFPRSEAAGLYGNSVFSFLQGVHPVFHSGFTLPPTAQKGHLFSTHSSSIYWL